MKTLLLATVIMVLVSMAVTELLIELGKRFKPGLVLCWFGRHHPYLGRLRATWPPRGYIGCRRCRKLQRFTVTEPGRTSVAIT
jgi:hypothetical protein